MLTRAEFLAGLVATPLAFAPVTAAMAQTPAKPGGVRTVRVPFDHAQPALGSFGLDYFVAGPFDRSLPTVIVVGDGQQFYIREALWAGWIDRFGDGINVVGVAGRGFSTAVQNKVGLPKTPNDWLNAHHLLNCRQWVDDLEAVRRDLLGEEGKASFYGASGGGRLVHEYLSRHGAKADRAYTRAAVFSYFDGEFGFRSDRFWNEIGPSGRASLADILRRKPVQRRDIAMLFQRQNFFVAPDKLDAARRALIADLGSGRTTAIARFRDEYQVNGIRRLLSEPIGPAIAVRMFEFFAPVAHLYALGTGGLNPDIEVMAELAEPLSSSWRSGRIRTPTIDSAALHRITAEVLMLAGRHDHTADYRSQVALAASYPRHKLILLEDNHSFARLGAIEIGREIALAWRAGLDSSQMHSLETKLRPLLWRET